MHQNENVISYCDSMWHDSQRHMGCFEWFRYFQQYLDFTQDKPQNTHGGREENNQTGSTFLESYACSI